MYTRIIVHPGAHPAGTAAAQPPASAAWVRPIAPIHTGAPSAQSSTPPPHVSATAPPAQPPTAVATPSAQLSNSVNVAIAKTPATATINPAILQFQNPRFRPPLVHPQARTDFDLPTLIAPASPPTDQMVYEAPKDSSKRFFLPHYAIAVAPGAVGRTKWVSFEPSQGGYLLTIHLADVTPPALSQGNVRLDPPTRYLISASLQGRVANWDLTTVTSPQGVALTLTLNLTNFADRDSLYEAMTDPAAGAVLIVRRALDIVAPTSAGGQTSYARAAAALDTALPFTFSKDLDANVFARLGGSSPAAAPGWSTSAINWNGRRYVYFQSPNQPTQIYFLPDSFKVGRQEDRPRRPALAVTTQGTDVGSVVMTLSYLAAPVWDPRRIADAGPALQQALGLDAPPNLALFQATSAALFLNLPGDDPAAGNSLVEQKGALIDLAAGVQGSVTLGLTQFRDVYGALFDERSPLLLGEVRVKVGDDVTAIPFTARISDMNDEILAISSSVDVHNNIMTATLANAIESPIHVESLTGGIVRGNQPIRSTIVTTNPSLPTDLKPAGADPHIDPAAALTATLSPSTTQQVAQSVGGIIGGLLGGGSNVGQQAIGALGGLASQLLDASCAPQFDLSHVTAVPDPKATWRAMMQDQIVGPVSRSVTLKFVAAMLAKPSSAPAAAPPSQDAVMAVQVVFDNGQTVTFDGSQTADAAGFINQTMKMSVPVETFVLGTGPTDGYKYRTDVVTGAGIKQGTWTTDNRDTLFIVPN